MKTLKLHFLPLCPPCLMWLILFLLSFPSAQTGTVLDKSTSDPLSDARVQRKSDGNIVFTNVQGKFDFSGSTVTGRRQFGMKPLPVSFRQNNLFLQITEPNTPVVIQLFTGNGRKVAEVANSIYQPGTHNIPLSMTTAKLSIASITIGTASTVIPLISLSPRHPVTLSQRHISPVQTISRPYARTLSAADTLIVSKYGYATVSQPFPESETTVYLTKYPADSIVPPGMRAIPGGTFTMGSTKEAGESPPHQVTVSGFYMDTTEVTQSDFISLMEVTPWKKYSGFYPGSAGPYHPVWNIGWFDAALYCNARSKLHGLDTVYTYSAITGTPGDGCELADLGIAYAKKGYRMPTEAEWEYAARAGATTDYYWGNETDFATIDKYAWYNEHGNNKNWPVAQKIPNSFNLYDITGNVWEFCTDSRKSYSYEEQVDPIGPNNLEKDAIMNCRGGSWHSILNELRLARRMVCQLTARDEIKISEMGIRCILINR